MMSLLSNVVLMGTSLNLESHIKCGQRIATSSYSLCGLCLSLSSLITVPQTVRLFYFHCVLRLPNSSTPCFPFLRCEGMATVTNWPLHMHYGITLWAYFSEPLVKDSHKCLSSTEEPQHHLLQVTWLHITVIYMLWRGIQKHCTSRKWLT